MKIYCLQLSHPVWHRAVLRKKFQKAFWYLTSVLCSKFNGTNPVFSWEIINIFWNNKYIDDFWNSFIIIDISKKYQRNIRWSVEYIICFSENFIKCVWLIFNYINSCKLRIFSWQNMKTTELQNKYRKKKGCITDRILASLSQGPKLLAGKYW